MDSAKIGLFIKGIRKEKGLTQKQLADKIGISDKTVSKWERGCGLPEVSLWKDLSAVLGVNIEDILKGETERNSFANGNMKNIKYYICPVCGNLTFSTAAAGINCCGRKVEEVKPQKADETTKLMVEESDGDWYITSSHPMEKEI